MYLRNLTHYWSLADWDTIQEGTYWYANAHDWAYQLADEAGASLERVCAVTAALSPAVKWDVNKRDTEALIYGYLNGTEQDTVVSTYGQNKQKAIDILKYGPEYLGKGMKTLSFYQNILHPDRCGAVTVDRHAFKALHRDEEGGASTVGRVAYRKAREGYVRASKSFGVRPHELQAIIWTSYKKEVGR